MNSNQEPVLMSWSGGKDSCFALYEIQKSARHRVAALLTTVTRDFARVSMHGVRTELLEMQAMSLGVPLHEVFISRGASNDEYETNMAEAFRGYRDSGISSVIFGDLFLEDIRAYRDQFLGLHRMKGLYPVWGRNTADFIREFVELGFKAVLTCVDPRALDRSFAGKTIDKDFLASLPPALDPCGENGEFHTFVFDGPNFARPVKFIPGETVLRDGFWFCDLVPEPGDETANDQAVIQPRQKRCSRCNASFSCGPAGARGHCWCEDLPHVSLAAAADQDCLCPECLAKAIGKLSLAKDEAPGVTARAGTAAASPPVLVEGEDYYREGAAIVFTSRYLSRRGYCCESGCRHCPYGGKG